MTAAVAAPRLEDMAPRQWRMLVTLARRPAGAVGVDGRVLLSQCSTRAEQLVSLQDAGLVEGTVAGVPVTIADHLTTPLTSEDHRARRTVAGQRNYVAIKATGRGREVVSQRRELAALTRLGRGATTVRQIRRVVDDEQIRHLVELATVTVCDDRGQPLGPLVWRAVSTGNETGIPGQLILSITRRGREFLPKG